MTARSTIPAKRVQPPVSLLLPYAARVLLVDAANTDPKTNPGESRDRILAVEKAIARVKQQFPDYFRKEATI